MSNNLLKDNTKQDLEFYLNGTSKLDKIVQSISSTSLSSTSIENCDENILCDRNGNDRFQRLCNKDPELLIEPLDKSIEIALKNFNSAKDKSLIYCTNALEYIKMLIDCPSTPDSFHVVDLGKLTERYKFWKDTFNDIIPYYAVKANPDPKVIEVLARLGVGFDCASEKEITSLLEQGVSPDRIIFANTRKFVSAINLAKMHGIKKMTFDSTDELQKITEIYPDAELILRIKADDSHSSVKMNTKFGCSMTRAREMIKICYEKKVNLIGISFHVGSSCSSPLSYEQAIEDSAILFKEAKEKYSLEFKLLDIGGGWPGSDDPLFLDIAEKVKNCLLKNFDSSVKVISEPGRYFCAPIVTLATKIIGTDEIENDESMEDIKTDNLKYFSYFLSNGIYQSFFDCLYFQFDLEVLRKEGLEFIPFSNRVKFDPSVLYPAILFGPSCDSYDKLFDRIMLPEMKRGDYLFSYNLGAYYNACATKFNGIEQSKPYYFYSLGKMNV